MGDLRAAQLHGVLAAGLGVELRVLGAFVVEHAVVVVRAVLALGLGVGARLLGGVHEQVGLDGHPHLIGCDAPDVPHSDLEVRHGLEHPLHRRGEGLIPPVLELQASGLQVFLAFLMLAFHEGIEKRVQMYRLGLFNGTSATSGQ